MNQITELINIQDQVWSSVGWAHRAEDQTLDQVCAHLLEQVCAQVRDQVWRQVWRQIREEHE